MKHKICMTIGWIEINKKKYGGIVYNDKARDILSQEFDLDLIDLDAKYFKKVRYLKIPESLFYLFKLKGKKDLWIRDFFSTVTLSLKKTKGKNLVMVHHIGFSAFPLISRPFLNLLKRFFFYPNLQKVDAIVTVSEYWKNYLIKRGYKNVYKIYNSFDLSDFNISDKEVLDFRQKYNLQDKPIVYLGNCQEPKGVVENYKILEDLDVHLVTSGERQVKIPALNLNLSYREYLTLLKASLIVLTMSKFKEGWCRTAHEAMMLKTPVIGSGLGGMNELLKGGGQIVCEDFSKLREKVEYLLNNLEIRTQMGESGFAFAKDFTLTRLEKSWLDLMNKIL